MPYLFEFDSTHRVLRCTMTEPVTDDSLCEYCKAAANHVQRRDPAASILDLTQVSSIEVSSVTIRNLAAASPSPRCTSLPQFIVAPSDHGYGMARMFQLWGGQVRPGLKVVRSLAEAYKAIGPEEPQFEPIPDH